MNKMIWLLVLLSALFLVGCTSRAEYVPILINNGCSNSTTGECNCTVDRATIYSFLTDYNTTVELQEIFYPLSNPYNFINETTDSLNDTFSCDNADYYITSINISNGNITGVCAFDSEGESASPDGTGGWSNTSILSYTSNSVNMTGTNVYMSGLVGIGEVPGFNANGRLVVKGTDNVLDMYATLSTSLTNGRVFSITATGETYGRVMFYSDGKVGWGPGSATRDVILNRNGTKTLKVSSDGLEGKANFRVNGNITGDELYGNLNASYIQNAPWSTSIHDQELNTTNNVKFNSVNTSSYIVPYLTNISFYNASGSLVNSIYLALSGTTINTGGAIYSGSTIGSGSSMYSDSDIYTRGTGDDLWLGTSTQTASRARLYATGVIMLNTSTEVACSGTYEGAILYNQTTNKHMGCNGTAWNNLY